MDPATKGALQAAADAAGMSASALALMAIKEMLREGEARAILPEHLRMDRTEREARRARMLAYHKSEMARRQREQRQEREQRRQRERKKAQSKAAGG